MIRLFRRRYRESDLRAAELLGTVEAILEAEVLDDTIANTLHDNAEELRVALGLPERDA